MNKKAVQRRMLLSGGLPQDALHGARVTWFARSSALVEGQRGVIELTGERIRLRTDSGVLSIIGEEMTLRELSADAAMVEGTWIRTLSYDKTDAPLIETEGNGRCT